MKLCVLLLLAVGASATCFVDPVWSDNEIVVTKNIQFGQNYNNQTKREQVLTLDLYTPPTSDARTDRPAAVLVHGGSFETGSSTSDDEPAYALQLATRGYVVVSINYRLTGNYYGLESEQPPLDAAEDTRAAIRFVRKNAKDQGVDPDRIFVSGDSAGAITSLYIGYVGDAAGEGKSGNPGFSSAVRAAVPISGELKAQAFCKGLLPTGQPFGCAVDGKLDKTTDLKKGQPPLLMVHGTADLIVPYANAMEVYNKAQKVGITSKLITIPGAGHVPFVQLFASKAYMAELTGFLVDAMDLTSAQCPKRAA